MPSHRVVLGVAALALVGSAAPAVATTVVQSSVHLSAEYYGDFGFYEYEEFDRTFAGPATAFGSVLYETRNDQMLSPPALSSPGYASAAFGPTGLSLATVSGVTSGSNFEASRLVATVEQTAEMLIPSRPGTEYTVFYSFELFNMFVELWDYGGGSGSNILEANISYDVLLDGLFAYTMGVQVLGYRGSLLVRCYNCADPAYVETTSPGDVPRHIDFTAIDHLFSSGEAVELGTVLATGFSDTFTVETRMTAEFMVPTFTLDAGAVVQVYDPNGLALRAADTVRIEPVSAAVPLPSGIAVLLSGLAVFAAQRRRA